MASAVSCFAQAPARQVRGLEDRFVVSNHIVALRIRFCFRRVIAMKSQSLRERLGHGAQTWIV